MWKAQIVTPWVELSQTERAPAIEASGLAFAGWTDVTRQPAENIFPAPNAYTIEVECETEADLDAIAEVFLELWRDEIPADPITGGL